MSPAQFAILVPATIAAAAGLAMVCAFLDGVIRPSLRARATRKRLQALKTTRKPWPAWMAWLQP
jgi:hypothetical protein